MPPVTDPNVLVGLSTSDDAAVYKISDTIAAVLTVDFFTPVVDNPYDFGAIAVTNALSDIYAMGATPVIGLNLVAYPSKTRPLEVLEEILKGGADQAVKAGVSIVGGHSIDDPEPKYGMCVLGVVDPAQIIKNIGAKPGDRLILTKPIGTGIITTAIKHNLASDIEIETATDIMTQLNAEASKIMVKVGVSACTDITGFGLFGHMHEMLAASGTGARIDLQEVPVIEGVRRLMELDEIPGGTERNLEYLEQKQAVDWQGCDDHTRLLACDAQTAGGLLISVPSERADYLLNQLRAGGTLQAAVIGEVVEDSKHRIVALGAFR